MRRSDKAILLLTIVCAGGLLAFCAVFLIPSYDTEERNLSPRVILIEKHRIRRFPLFMCSSQKILEEQLLQFEGKTIWSARIRTRREFGKGFHVSPNEKFVVIEHWLHAEPIVILNLETNRMTPVPAPSEIDRDGHYYVYPFTFKRWADDSSAVILQVESMDGPKQLWRIDPGTGAATMNGRTVGVERPSVAPG